MLVVVFVYLLILNIPLNATPFLVHFHLWVHFLFYYSIPIDVFKQYVIFEILESLFRVLLEGAFQEVLDFFWQFGINLRFCLLNIHKNVADTCSKVKHFSMHHFIKNCSYSIDVSSLSCCSIYCHFRSKIGWCSKEGLRVIVGTHIRFRESKVRQAYVEVFCH